MSQQWNFSGDVSSRLPMQAMFHHCWAKQRTFSGSYEANWTCIVDVYGKGWQQKPRPARVIIGFMCYAAKNEMHRALTNTTQVISLEGQPLQRMPQHTSMNPHARPMGAPYVPHVRPWPAHEPHGNPMDANGCPWGPMSPWNTTEPHGVPRATKTVPRRPQGGPKEAPKTKRHPNSPQEIPKRAPAKGLTRCVKKIPRKLQEAPRAETIRNPPYSQHFSIKP